MVNRCAKCGSEQVMPEGRLFGNHRVQVGVGKPKGIWSLFNVPTTFSTVSARVCGNCGYIELYAEDARSLWERTRA